MAQSARACFINGTQCDSCPGLFLQELLKKCPVSQQLAALTWHACAYAGIINFVLALEKGHYLWQFGQFAWTHMILLVVRAASMWQCIICLVSACLLTCMCHNMTS